MSYVLGGGGGFVVNRNTGSFVIPPGPSAGQNVPGGAANAYGVWTPFLDGTAPIVSSVTAYTFTVAAVTQNITLPTVPLGAKLILATVNVSNAIVLLTPSGWSVRDSQNAWSAFAKEGHLFERTGGAGDSGSVVPLTLSVATTWTGAALLYVITGAASNAFGLSTIANGGPNTIPNATIVNVPGGAVENCLFISLGFDNRDSGGAVTTAPAGYSSLQSGAYVGGAGIYAAVRTNSASSEDPGNFTLSSNNRWGVYAIAVQPNSFSDDAVVWGATIQANVNAGLDYVQFDLGLGGPGAEVVKYKDRIIVRRDTVGDDHWGNPRSELVPAILVPGGERVSMRIADDVGGSLVHVCTLHCVKAADFAALSPT